jgi:hypothetical protein
LDFGFKDGDGIGDIGDGVVMLLGLLLMMVVMIDRLNRTVGQRSSMSE